MEPLEFLTAVWSLDHELQSASKRMHARLGVTGPQRIAIRLIGQQPGIGPADLARALRIHPSTLTGILRRLEDHGLVSRRPDPADARRATLTLTRAGTAIDAIRIGTIEASVQTALSDHTPVEIAATASLLDDLAIVLREQRW